MQDRGAAEEGGEEEEMRDTTRDDLLRRWNRAMAKWCAGSEFIDDPERCAAQIQRVMEFREGLAHRKGEKGMPLRPTNATRIQLMNSEQGRPLPRSEGDAPRGLRRKRMKINCAEALTIMQGGLMVEMGRVYELLNYMTGDNLYTHQLPRAARECRPALEQQMPALAVFVDQTPYDPKNWQEYLAEARVKVGDEFEITPLENWTHRDPLAEMVEMMGERKKVIVVEAEQ